MTPRQNRRILLIDDMPSIHEDFRKKKTRPKARFLLKVKANYPATTRTISRHLFE